MSSKVTAIRMGLDSSKKWLAANLVPEKNRDNACKNDDLPELFSPIRQPKRESGIVTSLSAR